MRLWADRRGQSVWVGFVLLLGILVIAFAGYQAVQVPQQNADTEFDHSQTVQEDLIELRNTLVNARSDRTLRSTSVKLGTRYTTRLFAINPPPPSGTLETVDPAQNVTISNAEVIGGPYTGPTDTILETGYDTRWLQYTPSYSEYQSAPTTVYEHSLVYNRFAEATIPIADQHVIDGDRLNIVLVEGTYDRQGTQAVVVDPAVLSGPTRELRIAPEGSGPVVLRLPTQQPGLWKEQLANEPDATVIANGSDYIDIGLEKQEYTLRMAAVGLEGGESRSTFDIALQDNVTQPATAVYNISWDRDAMAAQPGVTRVGERLEIVESTDTVDGVVVVTNQAGEPITSATVDIGTTDEGVVEVTTSTAQTDTGGTTTAALGVENTGSTRLYASAGDDTAVLGVDVVGQAYIVESVAATAGGGNAIDVTVDITTDDPNAELLIESLRPDGTVRDSTTVGAADGTYTIAGANQADRVRVTLRDGSGTVRDSVTTNYS